MKSAEEEIEEGIASLCLQLADPRTAEVLYLVRVVHHDAHSLARMAVTPGLYRPLWRPDIAAAPTEDARRILQLERGDEADRAEAERLRARLPLPRAEALAPLIQVGLSRLRADHEELRVLNPWDRVTYEVLVSVTQTYLAACERHSEAIAGCPEHRPPSWGGWA